MRDILQNIVASFQAAIGSVSTAEQLEALEQEYFSRKSGTFSLAVRGLKDLPVEEKKEMGKYANEVKQTITGLMEEKKSALEEEKLARLAEEEAIDVTQDIASTQPRGHIHPITQGLWEMEEVAAAMGFIIEDGPELESEYFVFEGLNIPKHHPARDSQDTFYLKDNDGLCMRSHVSNMQVRLMQKYGEQGSKPVRAAYPGRVFRNEAVDATHGHTFYQFEALMVDKEINIGHLVGVIKQLLKGLLKKDVDVRLRPSYFPFVEPGFELDMKVDLGKGEQWVEMLGCGLMHPHVLEAGGYDPKEWQGLAFGMGLDRLVMAKYGIEDVRHIHSGDMRFLTQF